MISNRKSGRLRMPATKNRFTSRRGLNVKAYRDAIKAELKAEHEKMAQETLKEFNEVVENWSGKTRPIFYKRVFSANVKRSGFGVYVRGDEHQKKTWEMIDKKGRKRKLIYAGSGGVAGEQETIQGKHGSYQTAKLMRFQRGYDPKTAPIAQYGGPGERFGGWARRKIVNLGAIKPRLFTQTIMNDFVKKEFLRRSKNAYQRAFDRAKRAGRS